MKTSLVQLKVGDKIIYEPKERNMPMTIIDYQLVPNGIDDPKIVCLITAVREDGFNVIATSDKFVINDDNNYESVYVKHKEK